MVSVYRPKLKRRSALRYGLLRNLLISCKIPYGRLDTIKPELRKKTKNNKPRSVSTPGLVVIFIYGESIALRRSSHEGGIIGASLFDYIGDDDDQDVLAVASLGRAQLAGLNILPVAGRDNIISRDQTVPHKGSLQACVLLGILDIDQSNLDLLGSVCRLGRSAGSHHSQSLPDYTVGVVDDVVCLDDLAITNLNSIVQSDLVSPGVGLRIDESLDSLQGLLSSLIHAIILLDLDAYLGQRVSDVLALDAIAAASQNGQCQNAGEGDSQKLLCHFHDFCLHNYE